MKIDGPKHVPLLSRAVESTPPPPATPQPTAPTAPPTIGHAPLDADAARALTNAAPRPDMSSPTSLVSVLRSQGAAPGAPLEATSSATQLYGDTAEARALDRQLRRLAGQLSRLRPSELRRAVGQHYREANPRLVAQIERDVSALLTELDSEHDVGTKLTKVFQKITGLAQPLPEGHVGATWPQKLTTGAALGLIAAVLADAGQHATSLPDLVTAFAAALVGLLVADAGSAFVHHALDNYGNEHTPIFGGAVKDFQWHHTDPNAESRSGFAASAWRTAAGTLAPLLATLVARPGLPIGVAVGVAALAAIFATENHKAAHRRPEDVPLVYKLAQLIGLSVSKEGHDTHHVSPHHEFYGIINGWSNKVLDRGFMRWTEALVFALTGVEPNTWRLDPATKVEALGLAGLDPAAMRAVEAKDALIASTKGTVSEATIQRLVEVFPSLERDASGAWVFGDEQARNTKNDQPTKPALLDERGRLSFEARRRLVELIPDKARSVAADDVDAHARGLFDFAPRTVLARLLGAT